MTDEIRVFEYQDKHSLLTLGWIHTHPTQSCFMSSVDLHSHFSYQMMLPEAIAIVVAPSKSPNLGIFRLTDPIGIRVIGECSDVQMFHPHVTPEFLYEEAAYIGYSSEPVNIVDLR